MMRGAQSGGVVTFEPIKYSQKSTTTGDSPSAQQPPILKGIRSRIVNAKRTDLSQKLKQKVISDNCSPLSGNLHGYNKSEYTVNEGGGKLVRGFFGHTRFATSSKATFEGTHPHQWSERRDYKMYLFGSASASLPHSGGGSGSSSPSLFGRGGGGGGGGGNSSTPSVFDWRRKGHDGNVIVEPRVVGVENYITHNGDFEFYRVRDKYYDVVLVQGWLEHVLETPLPSVVDSGELDFSGGEGAS